MNELIKAGKENAGKPIRVDAGGNQSGWMEITGPTNLRFGHSGVWKPKNIQVERGGLWHLLWML